MVRKRAAAQKGLSPEKKLKSDKEKTTSSEDEQVNGVLQLISHETEDYENSYKNEKGYNKVDTEKEIVSMASSENEFNNSFDELPDPDTFAKELSEKATTYWHTAKKDYNDFTNWTCLLQTVTEGEDNLNAARGAYNCFLRYYPYCYGYWKKFADVEKKAGQLEEAEKVFIRGINAIPVSIDLWVHYLNFTIQQNKEKKDGEKKIRSLFKEAIKAAGMEFRSNKLWDAFIEWEKSLGNFKKVTEIYDQLIAMPTQKYLNNWQKFKKHLESYKPKDVLPTEEYSKLMQGIDAIPPGMTTEVEDPSVITTTVPGEAKITDVDGNSNEFEDEGNTNEHELKETQNLELLRHKIIADRESIFVETAGEIKKRWQYEDAIKRPYFHVKPLEKSQIKNWKEYLDYELRQGSSKRICFLFERCMVACAMYSEFWEKYLHYIQHKDIEITRDVFKRACNIHLLKTYDLHLRWAVFEERNSNYTKAAQILENIDQNLPGMILITQRRVTLAHRMNAMDDIQSIYENVIQRSEKIEDKIYHTIKYSHALAKFINDKEKAREMLWQALALGKKHRRIYLQLLDLELHYGNVEIDYVQQLFESVEHDRNLNDEFRDLFAQRQVEFYAEYSDNIKVIIEVKERYEKLQERNESMKRRLSESYAAESSSSKTFKNDQSHVLNDIPVPPQNPDKTSLQQHQQQQLSSWYQPEGDTNYNWNNYYYNQGNQSKISD